MDQEACVNQHTVDAIPFLVQNWQCWRFTTRVKQQHDCQKTPEDPHAQQLKRMDREGLTAVLLETV